MQSWWVQRRALWRDLGLAALFIWAALVSVAVLSYGLVYVMALGE